VPYRDVEQGDINDFVQEYLHRPTAKADWWDPPHDYVLGGRDNHRPEHGTWLGMTRQGRIACLTNFREEGSKFIEGRRSRGAVVNSYLKTAPESHVSTEDVAQKLIDEGLDGIGGFSLLFGQLRNPETLREKERFGLAIVSNRSEDIRDVAWLCKEPGETHALSNAHYGDTTWPKVVHGEGMVEDGVKESYSNKETKEQLIDRLLDVLSVDTLPRQKVGEEWDIYLNQLRNSVFVPPIGSDSLEARKSADEIAGSSGTPNGTAIFNPTSGVYGTQKQTVILVDKSGKTTFFERTLIDEAGKQIPAGKGDRRFDFAIEGW
jgi:uncharacterized protein with NRDE domain